jgi:hypothetical protein
MKIEIDISEYNAIRRLSDFADWYLDDYPKHMYPEQYESDKEDVLQAQEVFARIDPLIQFS